MLLPPLDDFVFSVYGDWFNATKSEHTHSKKTMYTLIHCFPCKQRFLISPSEKLYTTDWTKGKAQVVMGLYVTDEF